MTFQDVHSLVYCEMTSTSKPGIIQLKVHPSAEETTEIAALRIEQHTNLQQLEARCRHPNVAFLKFRARFPQHFNIKQQI